MQRVHAVATGRLWEGIGLGVLAIAAGGAAMLFHAVAALIERGTIDRLAGQSRGWFVVGSLGVIVAGSVLASWIIARFAPSAAGGGVLPVKLAFWREFGVMRKREGTVKLIASAVTLGSGVSLGPEGPSMQIGAAIMSGVAGSAGVAKQTRRMWCAAGAAAGLAAVFNAPLAAITFVLEEIIGDLHSRLIGPIVVTAVVGALVGHAVLGPQPAFQSEPLGELSWRSWALVPFVAMIAAFGGAVFQNWALKLRKATRNRNSTSISAYRPVVGALVTWLVGTAAYLITGHLGVFGIGYADITAALAGQLAVTTALLLFVGKILATSAAVGSSGCGGIFAPSLFIGAMGGATLAAVAALLFPLSASEKAMLVMTGMTASLGAVIRTPLTSVLLIFEITNQWVVVPALMLAAVVSQVVSRRVNHHDMYEQIMLQDGQDPNQVLPPRHFKRWREIPITALATLHPIVVTRLDSASLAEQLRMSKHQRFPVVDSAGHVTGILLRREMELAIAGARPPRIEPVHWISTAATVGTARKKMLAESVDFLCLGDLETRRPEGIVTLHDLVRGESVLEDDSS